MILFGNLGLMIQNAHAPRKEESMSEYCRHCGVVSRNACSTYKREYLAAELSKCPNLYPAQRLAAAASAEDFSGPYTEMLRQSEELERYREKFGPL